MKPKRDLKKAWRELCADLDADDGVTNDDLIRNDRRALRKSEEQERDKTVLRLCAQVRRALSLALAGDCGDEHLQALDVLRVEPYPNASRLRVVLSPPEGTPASEFPVLHGKLLGVQHLLRHAVATGIHRKRTPKLVFNLCDGQSENGGDDD